MFYTFSKHIKIYKLAKPFTAIKLQLSGDIVANLQLQIEQIREYVQVSEGVYNQFGVPNHSSFDILFGNIADRLALIMNDQASITLTIKTNDNRPVPNMPISGIVLANGSAAYTNTSGIISGYVTAGSKTLKIPSYVDISSFSKSYTFVKGQTYTDTWTVAPIKYIKITSSKSISFSPLVSKISYSITAGGGGGACGKVSDYYSYSGGGGGGGDSYIFENISIVPRKSYSVAVGSGGNGASLGNGVGSGNAGGQTSFLDTIANGGPGGLANANGLSGGNNGSGGSGGFSHYDRGTSQLAGSGQAGTQQAYTSYLTKSYVGGGGGGGSAVSRSPQNNSVEAHGLVHGQLGETYGGKGASVTVNSATYTYTGPNSGTNGGGGGGGGGYSASGVNRPTDSRSYVGGAAGGAGFVAICII